MRAMVVVSRCLRELGAEHCVGGSVASARQGVARSTLDIDFVARLSPAQASALVRAVESDFYGDAATAEDAARRGASFNLIEMTTGVKIDVFVAGHDPIALSSIAHAVVDEQGVPIASAEDTVVAKLRWFHVGGEASERQWRDVIGVLRTVGEQLDRTRMTRLAVVAGVEDLLARADAEA